MSLIQYQQINVGIYMWPRQFENEPVKGLLLKLLFPIA